MIYMVQKTQPENLAPRQFLYAIPTVIFYDDKNCRVSVYGVATYNVQKKSWGFNPDPPEDSFKSLKLINCPENFRLELFDDNNYKKEDDYCIITTKIYVSELRINDIEMITNNNAYYKLDRPTNVIENRGDLAGEVSSMIIYKLT